MEPDLVLNPTSSTPSSSSTQKDYIALCCPPEYEHYGIQMQYIANDTKSLEVMRMLMTHHYVYPGSYIAIDLEGKLATSSCPFSALLPTRTPGPSSSDPTPSGGGGGGSSSSVEQVDIHSIQLGIPIPNSKESTMVLYWDFQAMPTFQMKSICMNHIVALLDVKKVIKLIHAGKNDANALKQSHQYEFSDPIINTQVVYFEWMRLIQLILELHPKCIDPPKLPKAWIPWKAYDNWSQGNTLRREIGLNEVYTACGYPENVFKYQSARSDLKQIYYALNDVAFLCQSYMYMMHQWGQLQWYYLKLKTHQKLMRTPILRPPSIHPHHHALVCHVAHFLHRRGPMRIPEIACDILTWGTIKVKQQLNQMEGGGGVRRILEQYPSYFQFVQNTFDNIKLKHAKIQLLQMPPVPPSSSSTVLSSSNSQGASESKSNSSSSFKKKLKQIKDKKQEVKEFDDEEEDEEREENDWMDENEVDEEDEDGSDSNDKQKDPWKSQEYLKKLLEIANQFGS